MFVTDVNDVKIYNLSAGKSLPDWLTDKKRRSLLKKNVDIRRRIELIQDFDMPGVATSVRITNDGQYILACGTYKPRVKCYDVNNLSLKFERCFDSEVVTFEALGDDYSKMVFLQCDRYLEFHAAHGRHYRLRIPKFGRDLSFHTPSCDLFVSATSADIYRFNLERGQFMQPFTTAASCVNSIEVNPEHHLLCAGTQEGTVEAWDPRAKQRCATLDVAMKVLKSKQFPSVTSMKFKNGLQLAVGTASGHTLIYDVRSSEPLIVKDHLNQLPVKKVDFNVGQNAVYSMDQAMLKIWDEGTGKQLAYIESSSNFNDFCTAPNTGLFFFAQEDAKMQTFYVPSLGPAPKWCAFLDNLTEEIESESVQNIYDDYKFVTRQELEELGLDHLEGTNLLRGYMHGFFIDMRLYSKAKSAIEPFAFEKYRKEKVRQQIEATRPSRLQIKTNLPKINQELALKLMEDKKSVKKKRSKEENLLDDNRFTAMFENPDFQVDKQAEEYRLLAPVLTRLDKSKVKKLKQAIQADASNGKAQKGEESTDEDFFSEKDDNDDGDENDEDTSDDEKPWAKEVKKEFKKIGQEKRRELQTVEMQTTDEFKIGDMRKKHNRKSLGDRLASEVRPDVEMIGGLGDRQLTFSTEKPKREDKRRLEDMRKHREERKKVRRSVQSLKLKRLNVI